MDVPYTRWYQAIEKRRSRRQFIPGRRIEPDVLASLRKTCDGFRPFPHARACLVNESTESVFQGIIGSYGKVKDAPAFIALIGDTTGRSFQEETGYTGEGLALEATALGLATCWLAMFKKGRAASLVKLGPGERMLAIIAIGYAAEAATLEERLMTGFGRTHQRLPLEKMVSGLGLDKAPEWARLAVRAARLAPSAMNRQPWGFEIGNGGITVSVRSPGLGATVSRRLDCGIAMLHIEVAAGNSGVRGNWQFLESPRVARFSAA
jgi:hypothetical protein